MNRNQTRIAALALFLYLSVSPAAAMAGPSPDRDLITGPGERIVRVIKKFKKFFRGIASQEDNPIPPTPRP